MSIVLGPGDSNEYHMGESFQYFQSRFSVLILNSVLRRFFVLYKV